MLKCSELALDRITVIGLYQYSVAEATAKRKYALYASAVRSTNRAIELMERTKGCSKLARHLSKVNSEIRICQRGIIDRDGVVAPVDNDVSAESVSQRMLSRKLARPLLQRFHPDAGGNVDLFNQTLAAAKSGDTSLLELLSALHIKRCNLTWRCTDGVASMRNLASLYESRLSKLRSNELSRIASMYIIGKVKDAEKQLAKFFRRRIVEREYELNKLITRSMK